MTGPEFEELFRRHSGMAYGLALAVAGEPAAAEDAVQEAFMHLWRKAPDVKARDFRAYLAGTTINAARDARRGEARRRAREEAVAAAPSDSDAAGVGAESAEARLAVRAALLGISEERRVSVVLHVVDDFSHREVAGILGIPASTVSHRIGEGLEEMRSALTRAGFAALAGPGLAAALQAAWSAPAPAALLSRIETLAADGASAPTSASVTAKGGLLVKIGLGVAAFGLAAGAAFWAVGSTSAEPAKGPEPAAAKPGKFSTPVWDDGARWQMEKFAGCDVAGHLDGPRLEMQYFSAGYMGRLYRPKGAGRYVFSSYDPATERGHAVAGWARGYLDGPFSRARMGGWDYVTRSAAASSPDGRYHYMTDGYNGQVLRCFDLEKQEVKTLLPDAKGVAGLVCDSNYQLYALMDGGQFTIIMPDGTTKPGPKVDMQEKFTSQWGASMDLDEKHGRIYATCYGTKDYYVWYWDLKDGSFHGVLPTPAKSGKDRGRNNPGPFDGINLYGQGSVGFGPDDPDCRYLYVGRVDTWGWFRLDLEKRMVAALEIESGGKGKPEIIRWSNEKFSKVNVYGGAGWMEDGSFISTVHSPYDTWRFLRIK